MKMRFIEWESNPKQANVFFLFFFRKKDFLKTNQKRPFGIKIIPLKVSKASFSEDKQKTAIWDDNDPFKGFNNQLSALSKRTSYIFPLGTTLNNLDALVNTETTVSDEELLKYTIDKEKDEDEIAIKDYDNSLPDHPKATKVLVGKGAIETKHIKI